MHSVHPRNTAKEKTLLTCAKPFFHHANHAVTYTINIENNNGEKRYKQPSGLDQRERVLSARIGFLELFSMRVKLLLCFVLLSVS